MSMTPANPRTRIGATSLGVTLLAVATGALPVAGLAFPAPARAPAPTPSPVVEPVAEPVVAVVEPAAPPDAAPAAAMARSSVVASHGPLHLRATLGAREVLRSVGRVDLVVGVAVADAPDAPRDPIDLALVVDTSASMSGVIGLVKKATLGAIERLTDLDRLVLVTYSDEARVVFTGPVTADAREQLRGAVSRFVAARGTNIGDGIAAGLRGLSSLPERGCMGVRALPRRLVLLSDGAPTVGETDPRALAAAPGAVRGSVGFSCVGLGAAYQERLLAAIADAGGGSFHHVDGPSALDRVYAAELDATRRLALRQARLRIVPSPGVEVERVTAWPSANEGGATAVALGDLSHGRELKVVVRLKVAPGGEALRDVAVVRLEGALQGVPGPVDLATGCLSVGVTDVAADAERARVAEVEQDVRDADVAERLGEARSAAARGEVDRARALVREAREVAGRDEVTFVAPSGEAQAVSLDALADDLAEGERSDRGRRALKVTIAAERAVGR